MEIVIREGGDRELALPARAGEKLAEAIWLSGKVAPRALCGGLGLCGRCRVRFIASAPAPVPEDLQKLSTGEIEAGWRLACHHCVPDCGRIELELPEVTLERRPAKRQQGGEQASLGIDFGTTTIHWQAVKIGDPHAALQKGSLPNPQGGAGADVISRLAYAQRPDGEERLSRLGREAIGMIAEMMEQAGFAPACACIAANSAMTEILLQKDIAGLAAAPYQLSYHGNEIIALELPGRKKRLRTVIPPLPAPFVGADIVAGVLALAERKRPFLLADLGTNAELVLVDCEGRLYLASAPLGPALEGIGPACGQPAGPGVITRFALTATGIEIGGESLGSGIQGISATGYIALLALLIRLGAMDAEGGLAPENSAMPLARKFFRQMEEGRLELPGGQYLNAPDVELLLKAKAAFRVAFDLLLQAANLAAKDLDALYLGGALGEYAQIDDLAVLGFVPQALARKTRICGNTSLAGACILAANPEKLAEAEAMCANARILPLAEHEEFFEKYIASMRWG